MKNAKKNFKRARRRLAAQHMIDQQLQRPWLQTDQRRRRQRRNENSNEEPALPGGIAKQLAISLHQRCRAWCWTTPLGDNSLLIDSAVTILVTDSGSVRRGLPDRI